MNRLSSLLCICITSVLLMVGVASPAALAQQNPRALFERARMLDESNRDLQEAIDLYARVAEAADGQRPLAAEAQLRVGRLYERLGQTGRARQAYQAVLDQYTDQAEAARKAQAKIAAAQREGEKGGMVARRVWSWESSFSPDFYAGDVSPDGRYLSDINWQSGDLQMIDLETGEKTDVTGKGYGYAADSSRFAWFSTFSPDGKRMATNFFLYQEDATELRLMNADGSESSVLAPARSDLPWINPEDWSPDGEHLLASIERADDTWQIGLVSTDDGSVRMLKSLSWRYNYTSELTFSPDGEWIAYEYAPEADVEAEDIYALASDGSRETTLVDGPADDELLGWTPGGRGLLFYSDRSGAPAIWALPVEDGQPAGEPKLLRSNVWGLEPVGFTREAYAYALFVERPRVHTAVLDLEAGELGSPRPVNDRSTQRSSSPAWSPDGNRLAYFHHESGGARGSSVVIQSMGGEVTRKIPLRSLSARGGLDWVGDDALVLVASDRKNRTGVYRLKLKDGSVSLLYRRQERDSDPHYVVGPEGRTIYLGRERPGDSGPPHHETRILLVARDLATGEERVLDTAHTGRHRAVSPDGTRLAYTVHDDTEGTIELRVVPTSGGDVQILHRRPSGVMHPPVAWTPDGEHIFFTASDPEAENKAVYSIPADGGAPRKLYETAPTRPAGMPQATSAHPDGMRVAFVAGRLRGDLWMLKDFGLEDAPAGDAGK